MRFVINVFFFFAQIFLTSEIAAFSHTSFLHLPFVGYHGKSFENVLTSFSACASPAGQISSVSNPLVKRLVRLRENSRFRQEEGSVLLVGSSPIQEVLQTNDSTNRKLKTLLLLDEDGDEWHQKCLSALPCQGAEIYKVSSQVMKKVSGLETAERHISVAEISLPPAVRWYYDFVADFPGWRQRSEICYLTARIPRKRKESVDPGQVVKFFLCAFLLVVKPTPSQNPGSRKPRDHPSDRLGPGLDWRLPIGRLLRSLQRKIPAGSAQRAMESPHGPGRLGQPQGAALPRAARCRHSPCSPGPARRRA
jgi:hypothetical protein